MGSRDFFIPSTLQWVRDRYREIEQVMNEGLQHQTTLPSARGSRIVWRNEPVTHALARWDRRHPDIIFQDGFRPWRYNRPANQPIAGSFDLVGYATFNNRALFVGTTRIFNNNDGTIRRWEPNSRGGGFEYRIFAFGGIYVNPTLGGDHRFPEQEEIAFPGGLRREFIRSAYEYDAQGNIIRLWVNNNFNLLANERHEVPNFRLPEMVDVSAGIQIVWWGGPNNYIGYRQLPDQCPARRPRSADEDDGDEMMKLPGGQKMGPRFEGHAPRRAAFPCYYFGDFSFYVFSDDKYIRVSVDPGNNDRIVTHPTTYGREWKTLACFSHIDAFLPYPEGGGVWAFCDNQYCNVNINESTGEDYSGGHPKYIDAWNVFWQIGWEKVDAVIRNPQNHTQAWIFNGDQYIRIGMENRNGVWQDSLLYGPMNTINEWRCLRQLGFNTIDFAIPDRTFNTHVFVFKGPLYACIDVVQDIVISGPSFVAHKWSSFVQAGFY